MKRIRTCLGLLVAISLLLVACTSKPATNPQTTEPVTLGKGAVAMVNGKPVTDQEFAQRVKVYELFYGQDFGDAQTQNALLDRYVNEVLLLEEAGRRGLSVSDQELAAQVAGFNSLLGQRYGGDDKLAEQKKTKNITESDIKLALNATLLIDSLTQQLAAGVNVTDAEIQSYYNQNLATQFTVKEQQIRARHILVKPDEEEKAKEILNRIKNGEDFAKLAAELSIDTGSAARGGDLGYFGKGVMVKPFEDAAFALKNINDLSEPVKSDFGWHIIQLTGRRAPGAIPLAEVKSSIGEQLKAEKADAELENLVKGLREKATVETVDLTQVKK